MKTCPNCGHQNPPDVVFCENCGYQLEQPATSQPLAVSQPQVQTSRCPNCGYENPAGANVCLSCGKSLVSSFSCPNCGRDLSDVVQKVGEVNFCPYCNANIAQPIQQPLQPSQQPMPVQQPPVQPLQVQPYVSQPKRIVKLLYGNTFVDVDVSSGIAVVGRSTLTSILPREKLMYVSREHLYITYDPASRSFYVEDKNSTNGTRLNGVDIRGAGPQALRDGDQLELAGEVTFTVQLIEGG